MKFETFKENMRENLSLDDDGNIILYIKNKNSELDEIRYYKPVLNESGDEELSYKSCAIIPQYVTLTPNGIAKLAKLAKGAKYTKSLNDLIEPLIRIRRFDTAIREASLLIETSIKKFYNSNLFGQRLIDFHINDVIKNMFKYLLIS